MIKITEIERLPSLAINCKIEHPVYGWVPFTASPLDVAAHGRAIYEAAHQHLEAGGKFDVLIESPAEFDKSPNQRLADLEAENADLIAALEGAGIKVGK